MKQYYDKLLHISITYMLVVIMAKFMDIGFAVAITFTLQCGKVVWNMRDKNYTMLGDCAANCIGYAITWLYL